MHLLKAFAAILFVISSSGCAFKIKTTPVRLNSPPGQFSGALVHREQVKSAITGSGVLMKNDKVIDVEMFNLLTERSLYDNITKFSRGKVRSDSDAQFVVSKVEITGEHPALPAGEAITLGFFSFFIPPLAAIKGELKYPVSVYYEFTDKAKKTKQSGIVELTVEGTYWGWYVGRPIAGRRLIVAEEKFVEDAAAVSVLNEIYARYSLIPQPSGPEAK